MKADTGGNITLSEIHYSWIDHILWCIANSKFPLILAPMGHGKSFLIAVALALWIIGRDPTRRIQILCNSKENATNRVTAIREYIDDDAMYHAVFPHVIKQEGKSKKAWSTTKLYVANDRSNIDPSICAYGVISRGTGSRCDDQIVDDVVDEDNAISAPAQKPKIVTSYTGKWFSRVRTPLYSHGMVYAIGTRWADKDLNDVLSNDPNFMPLVQGVDDSLKHINCHRGVGLVNGSMKYEHYTIPLWAEEFGEAEFVIKKGTQSVAVFSKAYQNIILDGVDHQQLISWKQCKTNDTLQHLRTMCCHCYAGVDLSSPGRKGNAFVVVGVTAANKRVPLYVSKKRTSAEIVSELQTIQKAYNPLFIVIENVGIQAQFIDMLRHLGTEAKNPADYDFVHKIVEYTTNVSTKIDRFQGIPSLDANFKNNAWLFPEGVVDGHTMMCDCAWCELYGDLDNYRLEQRDYDLLMALFFASHRSYGTTSTVRVTHSPPKYFAGFGRKPNAATRRF